MYRLTIDRLFDGPRLTLLSYYCFLESFYHPLLVAMTTCRLSFSHVPSRVYALLETLMNLYCFVGCLAFIISNNLYSIVSRMHSSYPLLSSRQPFGFSRYPLSFSRFNMPMNVGIDIQFYWFELLLTIKLL